MPTAAFSQQMETTPKVCSDPLPLSLSMSAPSRSPDLTVHRRTSTHHGGTLRILGHAAEYLVDSRRFSVELSDSRAAVHILMGLSREVFEEYAGLVSPRHPVTDWIMSTAVRVYGAA